MVSSFSSISSLVCQEGKHIPPKHCPPSTAGHGTGCLLASACCTRSQDGAFSCISWILVLFFGPLGKQQALLPPADDCAGVCSREVRWLMWEAGSSLSASFCRPGTTSLQQVTFCLGSWKQTSALKCGHKTYFAAFQATFSPSFCCAGDQLFVVLWPVFRCFAKAALLWSHGCFSPLTMRRAKKTAQGDILPQSCIPPGCRAGTGAPVKSSWGAHTSIAPDCGCCFRALTLAGRLGSTGASLPERASGCI